MLSVIGVSVEPSQNASLLGSGTPPFTTRPPFQTASAGSGIAPLVGICAHAEPLHCARPTMGVAPLEVKPPAAYSFTPSEASALTGALNPDPGVFQLEPTSSQIAMLLSDGTCPPTTS